MRAARGAAVRPRAGAVPQSVLLPLSPSAPAATQTHVFGDKSAVTAHLAGSAEEACARAAWEEQERRRKAELRAEATETSPELLARDVPGL